MDKTFLRNLLIFSGLLALCFGVMGYVLLSGDRQIQKTDKLISHTHELISQAEELSTLLEGMLSSQRGFILSGNADLMKEYASKKSSVSDHIARLTELAQDNPAQEKRLDDIREQFTAYARRLEDRAARFSFANIQATGLKDVAATDSLRDGIKRVNNEILREEYQILTERISAIETKKSQYFFSLLIGGLCAAIIILIFNSFLFYARAKKANVEKSLKNTEERFALAIQGMNDGIFDWDVRTGRVFYSRQFFGMLGQEREAFVGAIEDFRNLLHPEDGPTVLQHMERYLRRELSGYANTFRLRHQSGRWIWVNARAKTIFDEDGDPVRMVGAHTDITYMKEYQERLKEEKVMAERANHAKSDFLAHMSHEIRTPLTAINGIAEIFQMNQENLNEKQMQLVKTLHSSTVILKDLVNDVLDFSKIESGELELQEDFFDLGGLFEQIISVVSVSARQKKLDFSFEFESVKDLKFFGDSTRLRQILINVIGNGVKFTQKGDVRARAEKGEFDGAPVLRIVVTDTGIGIAPENIDLVFERFKQADSSVSRKYGGTGLGLSITRSLLELMGGRIFATSELGKGSTFTIIIPLKTGANSPPAGEKILNKTLTAEIKASLNKESRILLVEDYEGNIVVLSYILDDLGCVYDIARTGVEALNLWGKNHYDLILMDIQMPDMDGFTAASKIRDLEKERNLPKTSIIGMTAHALTGDRDKCIDAGMDAYLPKPIVETDLKAAILKHLSKQKSAAA